MKPDSSSPQLPDSGEMSETMAEVIARSQKIATDIMAHQTGHFPGSFDPVKLGEQVLQNVGQMRFDPAALMQAQTEFWQGSIALWQQATLGMLGGVN